MLPPYNIWEITETIRSGICYALRFKVCFTGGAHAPVQVPVLVLSLEVEIVLPGTDSGTVVYNLFVRELPVVPWV